MHTKRYTGHNNCQILTSSPPWSLLSLSEPLISPNEGGLQGDNWSNWFMSICAGLQSRMPPACVWELGCAELGFWPPSRLFSPIPVSSNPLPFWPSQAELLNETWTNVLADKDWPLLELSSWCLPKAATINQQEKAIISIEKNFVQINTPNKKCINWPYLNKQAEASWN